MRGRRPGFGPLSLRSDQTGHRGLGEERKERERAHACACPGTREEDRESPRPRPRPRAFLLGPSCTFSRRTSHAYKTVTCIEQAWAPSLVSDGAGRPSAGARLSRADATGGWIYRYIDAGPRWRPGGRPRHRGQLPTAPAPLPEQTCARCSGRTCSGQLAALSAVDAGVPTTRSLNAAPARGRVEVCRWARWRCRWAPPRSLSPLVFAPSGADRARAGAVRLAARRPTAHEHSATHRWAFFEHGRPFFSQKNSS